MILAVASSASPKLFATAKLQLISWSDNVSGVGTDGLLTKLHDIFLLSNNFSEIHSSARSVGMAIGVPV
ncbi:hypothetical protein DEO72_LG2g5076 [Vigna unguiculata]|uniref:Uncharacterized protein n=1 Tax=Vigna unguiculata TaxID=3917 RepID=A0A4D6L882_VIGUN|nr:hypothetical protein DEO72_LG2g5076 [Vigna unguiculata]